MESKEGAMSEINPVQSTEGSIGRDVVGDHGHVMKVADVVVAP